MDILANLNDRQREAVLATQGPVLVLAGAGSGKTKVIAHRISNIIERGVNPSRILAITFTNKASNEMKERIDSLISESKSVFSSRNKPFVGTFHSLGVYILKNYGPNIGIPRNFTILDDDDTKKIFKELVESLELDPELYDPVRFRNSISKLKSELIDFSVFSADPAESPYEETLRRIYSAYERKLQISHSVDFDDLLLKPVMLLKDNADILNFLQDCWHYIHIDEYQDTNEAQYNLAMLLAEKHKNIMAVGDIDQAIYSWRGADIRNILNFERDFKGARVIALEENYRSTKIILEAAHAVIVNNKERKDVRLKTNNKEGEKLILKILEDEKKEAISITEDIKNLALLGHKYSDIAVLYRTNAQSRAIEEALIGSTIPYKLIAGVKFYERKEIKDVVSYLKYIHNSADLLALKRIINTPPRGIGKALTVKYFSGGELKTGEKEKITTFENLIKKIKEKSETSPVNETLKFVIDKAGFKLSLSKTPEGKERFENIMELLSVAKKMKDKNPKESLESFLEEVSLMSDQDEINTSLNKVHLLTAHAAKGLEFKVVIITGLEEGLFPHILSQEEGGIEEERRLFYVALTRAKEKAILTLTYRRVLYGELTFNDPSRFLGELPRELVEIKEKPSKEDGTFEEESVHYD